MVGFSNQVSADSPSFTQLTSQFEPVELSTYKTGAKELKEQEMYIFSNQ